MESRGGVGCREWGVESGGWGWGVEVGSGGGEWGAGNGE